LPLHIQADIGRSAAARGAEHTMPNEITAAMVESKSVFNSLVTIASESPLAVILPVFVTKRMDFPDVFAVRLRISVARMLESGPF
jgi:hypothetical protein